MTIAVISPRRIGITGQAGFMGTHLYNTLGLQPDKYERIPFEDAFFDDRKKLEEWVSACDVIIHLAAMNRHNDPNEIYHTNIRLVRLLIDAMEETKSTPHVLFASSTQEERDNQYGKSKKEGRSLLESWAEKNQGNFTGLIIPNVFGPFGNPYYNSVVATFCHQLTHDEQPLIDVDGELKLIYVAEVVQNFMEQIDKVHKNNQGEVVIETIQLHHSAQARVSAILEILGSFRTGYFEKGEIPALATPFERNLFITFLCFIDHKSFFPYKLKLNTDQRGSFVETIRHQGGGQVSFSTTVPGITRGNHFHTRKAERFAVIKGRAVIELRRIGTREVLSFELDGDHPSFVDMPVWYTHNITNIGKDELYTIFWSNEQFDPDDPDTYFEKV
ncbi:MAG: NAD-dependent epimerase/dehydratase family protein [Bacteroidales bacterium]|nr:NAD-dependent epimerase/dehydratase family protein [Bacteroidales bacterium]